jgi:hypothetical protein
MKSCLVALALCLGSSALPAQALPPVTRMPIDTSWLRQAPVAHIGESFSIGRTSPAYMIDGVLIPASLGGDGSATDSVLVRYLKALDPEDIAAVSVLKGPSARAEGACNGELIVITTKQGNWLPPLAKRLPSKRPVCSSGIRTDDSVVVLVRSDSGKPVAGAVVSALDSAGRASTPRGATDEQGRVVLVFPDARDAIRLVVRRVAYTARTVVALRDTIRGPLEITLYTSPFQLSELCTTDVRPAIELLLDPVLEDSTLVTMLVRDGAYEGRRIIPIREWRSNATFAGERAGTYVVTVTAPGYETWRMENVRVNDGRCHVSTKTLKVRLVRAR